MKEILVQAQRLVEKKWVNGVEFHVAVSPFLFPERLECEYLEDDGCLRIAFKYLDAGFEDAENQTDADGMLTMKIGKATGRILSVNIHVDRHDVDEVRMRVVDELNELPQTLLERSATLDPALQRNFQIAEEVLRQNLDEIRTAVCV